MSEEYDTLIARAFEDLRASTTPSVRAPGTRQLAVRAARRRSRLVGFSVVGAVFFAIPAVALVADQGLPPGPAQITPPAVDAKIFVELLAEAGAPVPADPKWGQCSSRIARKPATHTPYAVFAEKVVYTNLDNDPAVETAALVRCMLPGGRFESQVVAYDRDSSGQPVSLGAIVPPLPPNEVIDVQLREDDSAGVSARVVWDSSPAGVSDPVGQVRDFAWNGTAFVQVSGETGFSQPLSTDISVSSPGPLELTGKTDGHGVLRFTVTNSGPNPTQELKVVLDFGLSARENVGRAAGMPIQDRKVSLKPGESTTFEISVGVDAIPSEVVVAVYSHIIDTDLENNHVTIPIVRG